MVIKLRTTNTISFDLLKKNIFINDLSSKFEVFNLALDEFKKEEVVIKLSPDNYGDHRIMLDLNDLNGFPIGSGVYFIQLESSKEQAIKKCIILRN